MFNFLKKFTPAQPAAESAANLRNDKGETAVHLAAKANNVDRLIELLGAPELKVNAQTDAGDTALLIATRNHQLKAVNALLEKGASKTIKNKQDELPIHFAVTTADHSLSLLLVEKETLDAPNVYHETPLHYATRAGSLENVKMLLANSGSLTKATVKDPAFTIKKTTSLPGLSTPVHYALYESQLEILREMMRYDFNPSQQNQRGETAGFLAVSHAQAALLTNEDLQALLARKAVTKLTVKKESVLHAAVKNQQISAGQFTTILSIINPEIQGQGKIIDHGLINAQNNTGKTALIIAAEKGDILKAQALLDNQANPDLKDNAGFSAFMYAAKQQNLDMLRALKKAGADFSGEPGQLAIKNAALKGHFAVVTELIKLGAPAKTPIYPSEKNKESGLTSSISISKTHINEGDGKDLTRCIKKGDTPLHIAVRTNNSVMAEASLEADKSLVNFPNSRGKTPAHSAVKLLKDEIAPILQAKGEPINECTRVPGSSDNDPRYYTLDMATSAVPQFTTEARHLFFQGKHQLSSEQIAYRDRLTAKYNPQTANAQPAQAGASSLVVAATQLDERHGEAASYLSSQL
ncbi:ankyrin repeat-containing protein [Legionella birminghamensis]|uniref:Ankyrin repeat-containing protein n=1 Tax=Legionella birminghamensis TaxID=28083 RepID=A0A378ID24_9GAMM|nr:ankyrin repeat domain-containing protein [Legionella birminghamensis]KTC66754.1 ankyrin repeat-containing protein [Legionella birminghamensis]STX32903.1 ankyrin repeat-containing protein [Legionella birminghamensis]